MPLRKWFAVIYPMCAFKRGIGAQQIQVQAKVTYKTAWHMCQRIREAMEGGGHVQEGTMQIDPGASGGGGAAAATGGVEAPGP